MVRCLRYANHYPSSVGLPTSAWSVERTESDGRGTTMRPPPTYRQRGPGRRAGKARTQPGNTQQWAPIQSRGFPLGVRSAQRTALLPQSARKTKKDVAHQATKDREEHPPVTHSAGLFRQPADGGPMQPRAADALAQSVSDITAGWAAAQGVDPSTLAAASLVRARSSIAAGPEVLRCLVRTTTGTVVPTPTLTERAPPAHRAARRAAGASTTLAVIRRPALANRANPTGVQTLAADQHESKCPARLRVPTAPSPGCFHRRSPPAGSAPITRVAWSLPLTTTAITALPEVGGPGAAQLVLGTDRNTHERSAHDHDRDVGGVARG